MRKEMTNEKHGLMQLESVLATRITSLLLLLCCATIGSGSASAKAETASTEKVATGESRVIAKKVVDLDVGGDVSTLAFSPDGKQIAARTPNSPTVSVCTLNPSNCRVWASDVGEQLGDLSKAALTYSPDGRFLALIHDVPVDMTDASGVDVWSTTSKKLLRVLGVGDKEPQYGSPLPSLEFSPDSRWLLRLNQRSPEIPGDQLIVVETSDWQRAWGLRTLPFHPHALALSPDGRFMALGGDVFGPGLPAPQANIWIVSATTRAAALKINAFPVGVKIEKLSWSSDGLHVAAGASVVTDESSPENIKVFDVRTGKSVASVASSDKLVYELKYARGGRYLIEDGTSGVVNIWDSTLKHLLQQIDVGRGLLVTGGPLSVSRDGRLLAIGAGAMISVWKLK